MSILKNPIDYNILEEELHEAVRADELYKLQNDAKFRAIEQAVPTYDDFKEMVNAAHLKPLDRKDMKPNIGVKWNSVATDKSSQFNSKRSINVQQTVKQFSVNRIPRNTHEFRRAWKGIVDYREKFELLDNCRPTMRDKIFRSEIPHDILNDSLCACIEYLKLAEKSSSVIDVLITISGCNRFKLAVAFMSDEERNFCSQLFEMLRSKSCTENDNLDVISDLEKIFMSPK